MGSSYAAPVRRCAGRAGSARVRLLGGVMGMLALLAGTPAAGQALSAHTVRAVEQMLVAKMAQDSIPGLSVAVVVDGRLAWSKGYGLADVENAVPATPETAYRTASVGKTITATAVMQLAEDGRIDLDAPVQRYCPAFPKKRWLLTARHLLGHLGGVRHYGGPDNDAELLSATHYDGVVDALAVFKDDSLLFEPGTAYVYSTYGYNVLGCVVEGASEMAFMDYLHGHVFGPAGMAHTRADDPYAIIPHRAAGYRRTETGSLRNAPFVDMSNKMPAGGYITTVEDLARFAVAFMDGILVRAKTRTLMLTPQVTTSGEVVPYGLGWGLFPEEDWYGEKEAFHGGVTPGVSSMLYLLPDRRFAVALQMNLEGVSGRTALAAQIAREVLGLE